MLIEVLKTSDHNLDTTRLNEPKEFYSCLEFTDTANTTEHVFKLAEDFVVYRPRHNALQAQDAWALFALEPKYLQTMVRQCRRTVMVKHVQSLYVIIVEPRGTRTPCKSDPKTISEKIVTISTTTSALGRPFGPRSVDHRENKVWCLPRSVAEEKGGTLIPIPGVEGYMHVIERHGKYDGLEKKYPSMDLNVLCSGDHLKQKGLLWLDKSATRSFTTMYDIMQACINLGIHAMVRGSKMRIFKPEGNLDKEAADEICKKIKTNTGHGVFIWRDFQEQAPATRAEAENALIHQEIDNHRQDGVEALRLVVTSDPDAPQEPLVITDLLEASAKARDKEKNGEEMDGKEKALACVYPTKVKGNDEVHVKCRDQATFDQLSNIHLQLDACSAIFLTVDLFNQSFEPLRLTHRAGVVTNVRVHQQV